MSIIYIANDDDTLGLIGKERKEMAIKSSDPSGL